MKKKTREKLRPYIEYGGFIFLLLTLFFGSIWLALMFEKVWH